MPSSCCVYVFNEKQTPRIRRVCLFQFSINSHILCGWVEKFYSKDKFNKSTHSICLIYFSLATFDNEIRFWLLNSDINDFMFIIKNLLINFFQTSL